MGAFLQSRQSRRLAAGIVLILLPAISVFATRGKQRPWVATAPPYRQKGPADAKVVIVEYSDFECPACRVAQPALKQIESLYSNDVRVVFKHMPWSFHEWATLGAAAAECAGRQGKFWDFHDQLYGHQEEIEAGIKAGKNPEDFFLSYAKSIGLDAKALDVCRKDAATLSAVQADVQEADDHWVHSTPTFFINGKRFVGANQLRTVGVNAIERAIASKQKP